MKTGLLIAAAMTMTAFVAHAQQGGKPAAAAPETTRNGTKAADAKKADKSVKKKAKVVVEDYAPLASEYGQKAKCPVSGDEFKVGEGTQAIKYKGKVYYFCCGSCMPKFKKNPAKFAK